jgi:hypothetical protein
MEWDEKERRAYLKDEYLFLQNQYEDYDKRSLVIKGWVSAGSFAAMALAFNSAHKYAYFIPIFIIVLSGVFWYLESYWKLFQYALQARIKVLEAEFRDDHARIYRSPDPFQIFDWWFKGYRRKMAIYHNEQEQGPEPRIGLIDTATQQFVFLPYLVIILLCVISFILLVRG